jgi:cytochrome c-type biogenesis protein CcmF
MASEQTTSEIRIESRLMEDVYVVFAGVNEDDQRAIIQVWINPLVLWVWIGGMIMGLGTIYTMLPNRKQRRAARDKKVLDRLLRASEVS